VDFAHYPPGVANPPGRSTHELRSDGVAYAGPAGRPLFWWQCGIDVDDAHVAAFIAEARKRGWVVTITYPTSTVEHHHVNFRKKPMILDRITVLKKGDKGARVKRFTAKLANIPLPNHPDKTYLGEAHQEFDGKIEDAVKKFQGDHHLKTDGVVGPHTRTQIRVSWRQSRKGKKND
jgi:peptidoglycan hydrolase-like protein with peptidoglycan-binding domain